MRDFELPASVGFSSNIIDRAAYWLNRRSQAQIWCSVMLTVGSAMALDVAAFNSSIDADAFYIVPISLACWMFKFRKAIDATAAILLISLVKYPLLQPDLNLCATFFDGIVRVMAFTFLALLVLSYRQVFDCAQSLATHDRMTGALNKEAFNMRAKTMLNTARSSGGAILLTVIDLDGFKAVNDEHGHHAGDVLLREFSSGLAGELRLSDCFGRIGGDEFAVLLEQETTEKAEMMAGNLHAALLKVLERCPYHVTCSSGSIVAQAGDTAGYEDLFRQADRLMYEVKRSGKNGMQISRARLQIDA